MFITIYQDASDHSIHVYLQETKPIVPEDYQTGCNLLVFDTSVKFASTPVVVSKASILETLGEEPQFGDDSQCTTLNCGVNEDFGIRLRPVYESYDIER